MLDRHTVVAAYNATDEAGDGLALARVLAGLTDTEVLIVRVLDTMVERAVHDRSSQAQVRDAVQSTRRALIAAVPDDSRSPQVVPVLDPDVARGLHDAAQSNDADYLVLGSSHHRSGVGRILIGGSAETVVNHAPCPVAVAPPGFRENPQIAPALVACAYDGSPEAVEAVRVAVDLARAGGMPLRVVAVGNDVDAVLDDGVRLATEHAHGEVVVDRLALRGDPGHVLVSQSEDGAGILVMGSRKHGPIRRALLGSVSTHVLRHASCPVLITPRHD